jgi:SpoVK/Ycf46/Vps4 family AAA+-type ATPase
MIGLEDVKDRVNRIIDMVRWQDALKASNRRSPEISHHMIFSGNPGTGKTTVARIMGEFFKSLKMLSKGHFVEVDRQGLVGGYIGQTAEKTMKVLQESLGGVLFIDEAYSLVGGSENDFGKEAISTLLKFMEDNRGNLIVIAAGYEKDMNAFVKSNPGLESRFKTKIAFPDYSNIECVRIFEELARSSSLVIENDEVSDRICEIVEKIRISRGETFANGRDVRNLFEAVIGHIATRSFGHQKNKSPEDIYTIKVEDIANALRELE